MTLNIHQIETYHWSFKKMKKQLLIAINTFIKVIFGQSIGVLEANHQRNSFRNKKLKEWVEHAFGSELLHPSSSLNNTNSLAKRNSLQRRAHSKFWKTIIRKEKTKVFTLKISESLYHQLLVLIKEVIHNKIGVEIKDCLELPTCHWKNTSLKLLIIILK